MYSNFRTIPLAFLSCLLLLSACSSVKPAAERPDISGFTPSGEPVKPLIASLPDYLGKLHTVKGEGKAIVSEPGNTERVTVLFSSTRDRSLVTVKNSIGIEGGQLLTDGDSLLIYNKIDKFARKVDIRKDNLSRIDNLASMNILGMLNYTVSPDQVERILQNPDRFLIMLKSGVRIFVMRDKRLVSRVVQPASSDLPYSEIIYEGYTKIREFRLPRRITIFSEDEKSRINLLIQSLDVNPDLEKLTIDLPENTTIYYQ